MGWVGWILITGMVARRSHMRDDFVEIDFVMNNTKSFHRTSVIHLL